MFLTTKNLFSKHPEVCISPFQIRISVFFEIIAAKLRVSQKDLTLYKDCKDN